jgi:hypothetical protein
MATYKKWAESELEFIRNNQKLLSDDELAAKLGQMTGNGVTTAMVRRQRRKLGIQKPKGRRPKNRVVESPIGQEITNT